MRICVHRRVARGEHGFSMVEALVGLVLLAGLTTAMLSLTVESTRSVERSARISSGLAWATAVLDLLQAAPPGHPWVVAGGALDRGLADGTGTWYVDTEDFQIRWRVEPLTTDRALCRLEVAVTHHRALPGAPFLAHLVGLKEIVP